MKRVCISIALLLMLSVSGRAQGRRGSNESSIRIKGGINFANVSVTDNGSVDAANKLTSFHVGIMWDLPIVSKLALQFGLLYSGKGIKTEGKILDTLYKSTVNPSYVEVPVQLIGRFRVAPVIKLFIGAGPYAAIGIGGTNKLELTNRVTGSTIYSNKDIRYDDDRITPEESFGYPRLKRFDYGINFLGGVEISRFVLGVNYGLGLTKIRAGEDNQINDEGKHRVLSVSLGIRL